MTTNKFLKQLNNKKGGVHTDAIKIGAEVKAAVSQPASVSSNLSPESKPESSTFFSRFFILVNVIAFFASFWLIFQLVSVSQVHEIRLQRVISVLDKQEAFLKSMNQKMSEVSIELSKINENIATLAKKTDAAYVEVAKLNEVVAGQAQTLEGLKQQAVAGAAKRKLTNRT